jgi:hypothetical protein
LYILIFTFLVNIKIILIKYIKHMRFKLKRVFWLTLFKCLWNFKLSLQFKS